METDVKFKMIIVGDELLSGKRRDKHLPFMVELLAGYGLSLDEVRIVGDEPELLTRTFHETLATDAAVFSFGGIGATPDDITRQCFAAAAGCELVRHPEFVKILEEKFGADAYPNRIHLTEFPQGASLIPNPVNRMAGFSLHRHHFVPGFPDMAQPMIRWVMEHEYSSCFNSDPDIENLIQIIDHPESDLIPLIESTLEAHPAIRIASLPSTKNRGQVELGVKGQRAEVEMAKQTLLTALDEHNINYLEYSE